MKINAQGFYTAVGRRKSATARIRMKEGSGKILVNNSESLDYFKKKLLQMDLEQPLDLTGNNDKFDIFVNVRGGGLSGQAGATRLGIARALVLLSDGEGMANVMMEAIGCRLPMVYSDGCVFSEIARRGGGVQIAPNEPEVAIALNHILSDDKLHSDQVEALGKISHDYAWSGIAARSAYLYEKVLTERQKT
jgi:ribosomal protein S9